MIKLKIKKIVETQESKAGYLFDLLIQCLIIISIATFSIETLPNLSEEAMRILNKLEGIIVGLFTIEYLLRLYTSNKKIKYIFSFYALIDLLAILPYYISAGIDLRSIRIVRLVRLLKLFRFNKSLVLLKDAFLKVKSEMMLFVFITTILLYVSAVGIYFFENSVQPEQFKSIIHSLWWAVTTLTTVGYGDMYPITIGGKIFTAFISLMGIGIVAIPTGLLASSLTSIMKEKE
mgnify:CR=1 FL=1